jgi:hypothetical protein
MKQSTAGFCGNLAMMLMVLGLVWPAAAGEEATINAFATWAGQGNMFQTGAKASTFVGALVGKLYTETEKGPVPSGQIVCPTMVRINADGTQRGTGDCTITDKEGAQIFAEVACTGVYLVGCQGEFKLTGGTARFEGISGSGPVTIRSELRQTGVVSAAVTTETGTGILYLKGLRYAIP